MHAMIRAAKEDKLNEYIESVENKKLSNGETMRQRSEAISKANLTFDYNRISKDYVQPRGFMDL